MKGGESFRVVPMDQWGDPRSEGQSTRCTGGEKKKKKKKKKKNKNKKKKNKPKKKKKKNKKL
eukprot:NODE_20868_length_778_cov_6.526882.p2 GENE.NODE_20868_length_778_cov_6.526882~~NODE_20868_length_778_cov_6.526882.p2  ORF type:complete len:62 (-),score=43.25 NODE_20868_length_778_cov_6.526882:93-278(-)